MTTTTTYTYDTGSLQPVEVVVTSTDGSYSRTATTYAHEQYGGMESQNMLSQAYAQTVYAENGDRLACSRVTWKTITVQGTTTYVPNYVHEGCGSEEEATRHFEEYDPLGRPAKIWDNSGLRTFFYYGTNTNPFATNASQGQGPRLTGVRRTGFGVHGTGWSDIH